MPSNIMLKEHLPDKQDLNNNVYTLQCLLFLKIVLHKKEIYLFSAKPSGFYFVLKLIITSARTMLNEITDRYIFKRIGG